MYCFITNYPNKKMSFRVIAVGLLLVIVVGAYIGYTMTPHQNLQPAASQLDEKKALDVIDQTMPADESGNATGGAIASNDEFGNDSEIGKPCTSDSDCKLPYSYAVLSSCPYEMRCTNGSCEVFCPWDENQNGSEDAEVEPPEPVLTLFWGEGCPHCAEEKEFLDGIKDTYPDLDIVMYEVKHNDYNLALFMEWCSNWGVGCDTVPMTFIGDTAFTNFMNYDGTFIYHSTEHAYLGYKNQIENAIREVLGMPLENASDWKAGISISASTDKGMYYSKDPMNITVVVRSAQYVSDCTVGVKGLKGKSGFYVNSKKSVDLNKGNTAVLFEETAPRCFGCGGFSPGEYEIRAWVENGRKVIRDVNITVEIMEEDG